MSHRVLSVISRPSAFRQDFEIQSLMPWLRKQSQLFSQLRPEYLKDIIRNCGLVSYQKDDIIIRQGDQGDCFYIILNGKISIYILNKERDEDGEETIPLEQIGTRDSHGKLDRAKLGNFVTHLGTGVPFGDVALSSDDCVRTATIIAEENTDLLVVDRSLYNRAVKEVLAKEYEDKVNFIKTNPLFSNWIPRYRKQLSMAIYKESFPYNSQLVRQGDPVDNIYFIISGHVELQTDPSLHPAQFPKIYKDTITEAEKLQKRDNLQHQQNSSHHSPVRRKTAHKLTKMCVLGKNESVGELEIVLDMKTYMQTAVCTERVEVLVLELKHYERLFVRRHPRTIDAMRRMLKVKLDTRRNLLTDPNDVPFLSNIQKKLEASSHSAPAYYKKEKELPSEKAAEKDFLNHKGPLIDMYGPGSVFYMIRLREKTKQNRAGLKNHRKLVNENRNTSSRQNDHLHSVKLPQNLVMAAQVSGALKSLDITSDSVRASSAKSNASRVPRSFRRIQSAIKAESEEIPIPIPDDILDGDDVITHRSWPQDYVKQTTNVSFVDTEENESLSKLENKVREWLEYGNPKSGSQVTQLKRLEIKDVENLPKPGNKVIVRKRSSSNPGSSSSGSDVDKSTATGGKSRDGLRHYRILLAQ
ncbi:hypothetical protein FSP39_012913 [Pinctada imbricata]|uniref:Cyclic nucleotide-binding domain-containing protein n=1 Tax=Pinctada imbricata TaxID=66713 RepID=A0AA88XM71_PINIB|nr:hypothetical protein FSP39_012913 [Pinctada imbricata]